MFAERFGEFMVCKATANYGSWQIEVAEIELFIGFAIICVAAESTPVQILTISYIFIVELI